MKTVVRAETTTETAPADTDRVRPETGRSAQIEGNATTTMVASDATSRRKIERRETETKGETGPETEVVGRSVMVRIVAEIGRESGREEARHEVSYPRLWPDYCRDLTALCQRPIARQNLRQPNHRPVPVPPRQNDALLVPDASRARSPP